MMEYKIGYEMYKDSCEKFNLVPVNFRYFIINLSQKQLDAFNDHAKVNR